MIRRSWKKFLSSCEGVAVLGSLGRLANTYTALCTRPGTRRVPASAAFPWGTRLGETGASWPRVLREESGAGEQSKALRAGVCGGAGQYSRLLRSALAAAVLGLWLAAGRMPVPFIPSWANTAGTQWWSRPVQGHGCLNPGWGQAVLVLAEFQARLR